MGHLGAERVFDLAKSRFYWPNMKEDITHYVIKVCRFLKLKPPARKKTRANATHHYHCALSDGISGFPPPWSKYRRLWIHFSSYGSFHAICSGLCNQKQVCEKIYNDFILRFGLPETIHHYQGGEFENQLFYILDKLIRARHSRTTPYNPQAYRQVERFNRTLLSMLRTLTEKHKSRWRDHLNKVVDAYNCTKNDETGYAPFFLLPGRAPCLPIDLMLNLKPPSGCSSYPEYGKKWRNAMSEA